MKLKEAIIITVIAMTVAIIFVGVIGGFN